MPRRPLLNIGMGRMGPEGSKRGSKMSLKWVILLHSSTLISIESSTVTYGKMVTMSVTPYTVKMTTFGSLFGPPF